MTGHQLTAESLHQLGVTHVYGVSGTPIHETLAACSASGIRSIGVRHQQAAVMMAGAQNFVSAAIRGVSILSAGPGVANGVTGMLAARSNCWPVLVLGGRRPRGTESMGYFQFLDGVDLCDAVTKDAQLVADAKDLPLALENALTIAISGRPGPVYLDVVEDALQGEGEMPDRSLRIARGCPTVDADLVTEAVEILRHAERPLLILGKGARWSVPRDPLRRLIEVLQMPFVTSPMGVGLLPDSHPLCLNRINGLAQTKADVVFLLGARLDWQFRFGGQLDSGCQVVQVEIDPAWMGRNRAAAVGILGDAGEVVKLMEGCFDMRQPCNSVSLSPAWNEAVGSRLQSVPRAVDPSEVAPYLSPHEVVAVMRETLPKDAIVALDGNVCMLAAQAGLPSELPASRLTSGSDGCMGVGIPYAIGAQLAEPERAVVVLCGDSAFGFNAMELETASRYGLPIVVIVANNGGISGATIQKDLYASDRESVTTFIANAHYERLAEAFGGRGWRVSSEKAFAQALRAALAADVPSCINVSVYPDSPVPSQSRF